METGPKSLLHRGGSTILRRVRFGKQALHQGADTDSRSPDRATDPGRHLLLNQISHFLLDNDLEITAANLAAAHGIFAGLNPGLRRNIEDHRGQGKVVEQEWLSQQLAESKGSRDNSLEQFAQHLEQGIIELSRNTRSLHDATSEYGDTLEGHVNQLQEAPGAGKDLIGELTSYAIAMLERSRRAEEQLKDSERQVEVLRRNLYRARREAEIDYLTGLPNRRSFENELERQVADALKHSQELSIAFCDIDHFKHVNDKHGHDAGDRIIRLVAEALAEVSKQNCIVARHGGEEFVLLFRKTPIKQAFKKLDAVREGLAARKLIDYRTKEPIGHVTFSAGITGIFDHPTVNDALKAADDALYQAKIAGRNRIHLGPGTGRPSANDRRVQRDYDAAPRTAS